MSKAVKEAPVASTERITSLRAMLEWLKSKGDLIETDKEINPDLEIISVQKQLDGGCPVLFNSVKE